MRDAAKQLLLAINTSVSKDDRRKNATNAAAELARLVDSGHLFDDFGSRRPVQSTRLDDPTANEVKMQIQINDLQNERSNLLCELRQAAIKKSDRAVRFVGLSAEDIEKLRLYAIRLKEGADFTTNLRADTGAAHQILQGLAKLTETQQENSISIHHLQEEFLHTEHLYAHFDAVRPNCNCQVTCNKTARRDERLWTKKRHRYFRS